MLSKYVLKFQKVHVKHTNTLVHKFCKRYICMKYQFCTIKLKRFHFTEMYAHTIKLTKEVNQKHLL